MWVWQGMIWRDSWARQVTEKPLKRHGTPQNGGKCSTAGGTDVGDRTRKQTESKPENLQWTFPSLFISKHLPSFSYNQPFCTGLQNHYAVAGSESLHPTGREEGTLSRAKKPLRSIWLFLDRLSEAGQVLGNTTLPIHGSERFPAPCFPK